MREHDATPTRCAPEGPPSLSPDVDGRLLVAFSALGATLLCLFLLLFWLDEDHIGQPMAFLAVAAGASGLFALGSRSRWRWLALVGGLVVAVVLGFVSYVLSIK